MRANRSPPSAEGRFAVAKKQQEDVELKEPDPFLKATIQLWDKLHEMRKQIGIALAMALVALLIFAGFTAHQEGKDADAGAALGQAMHLAQRPVQSAEAEKPETAPAPDDAPFKTDAERQTALAAALKDVRARYAGTDAAKSALLALGDAQLKLGQLDDAQKSYAEYVQSATGSDAFRALAELGLAKVAEAKKDLAAAAQAYETLQRDAPHSFLRDVAGLGKARMLEQQGKKQEAAVAYQEVKDGFQNTEAARTATARLAMLATQGVQAPTSAVPDAGSIKKAE
jgi:tetratricopeptide (TPR) repeat protein